MRREIEQRQRELEELYQRDLVTFFEVYMTVHQPVPSDLEAMTLQQPAVS